jgi:LacI family transcriptional regulator
VGYDDIDFARSAVVPLTSVRQPTQAIGATAIDLLLAAAEDGTDHLSKHVVFQPELITRTSTVP